ncbi:GNAT family N-acetyltransferase [Neptuniibacter sp. CAU 1671]|uniref:GNAT family N-acetyltransferase n=1 Tax=Neptuniibacter sp. CAU 1671 TaxID=3032593 RepID=UPI0023D99249|nr:GNAT family N-acetyltransferase [Neptuniibacter sp. CAU 1671]MDF2180485.1 GNAT family N-acetyltransferase [Neptuniibacter sp. CAU 1671]
MKSPLAVEWQCLPFDELSACQTHALLALRQQVFILEQQCFYQDADSLDSVAFHLLGTDKAGRVIATARLIPPAHRYPEVAIGRVATEMSVRGKGVGGELMLQALRWADQLFPNIDIKISAQTRLAGFYTQLGFETLGQPYDDEGIEHIDMLLHR